MSRPRSRDRIALGEVRSVVAFSDAPRKLADWYARAFEASEFLSSDDFIGLSLGSVSLFVQRSSEGHRPGLGGVRPHFTVEDCPESFARLVGLGARALLPPSDAGEEIVAAVQDPDGNPIGLLAFKGRR